MLAVELAGQGSWVDAPNWALNGGSPTYLGNSAGVSDLGLLAVIELAAVGFVDKQRTAETGEKRLYPGGSFDPLGYAKGDIKELQLKEIKNGALNPAIVIFSVSNPALPQAASPWWRAWASSRREQ